MAIKIKGDLGIILELEHRTPGNLSGFVQVIMRSFASGKSKDLRFQSGEKVDVVETDRQKLEFSYNDNTGYYFMNPDTYEQISIPENLIEESKDLFIENMVVEVVFVEGNPMSVDMPATVDLLVTEAADGLKGDTANNPSKPVTLQTGKIVQAPLFIKTGDKLRIDTRTGKYVSRA